MYLERRVAHVHRALKTVNMARLNIEANKFIVSVVHEIDAIRVTDLLVTAFENPYTTQWCYGAQLKSHGPVQFRTTTLIKPYLQRAREQAFKLIEQSPWYSCPNLWTGDFEIEVHYGEDDNGDALVKTVRRQDFLRALSQMAQRHTLHFHDFVQENDDAETADVFFQLAVLGDVIYG